MWSIKVQLLAKSCGPFSSVKMYLSTSTPSGSVNTFLPNQLDFHAQFRLRFGKALLSCTVEIARSDSDNVSTKVEGVPQASAVFRK